MKRIILLSFFSLILHILINAQSKPELIFSHERGFYHSSFQLTVSSNRPATQIYYTLDGSHPVFSGNALQAGEILELKIHPHSDVGRASAAGVVVRAAAVGTADTSDVETHTYLFLSEVKYQQNVSPELEPFWPGTPYIPSSYHENLLEWMQSDYQVIDLGVDPEVVGNANYFSVFENALLDLPSISLVADPDDLFNDVDGIYSHATWSGIDWEREGSVELIDPNDDGFQVNTGIRMRGGWSARGDFPKHAFRLFFRKEYGNGKLNFPLFGDDGAQSFDKIDLRCSQNNSWHVPNGNSQADFIRDVFARDSQGKMGQPYTRSRYYHLYLNGMYWGLYQTQERAEARFAASYFGGDKSDYDVVKSAGPAYDYPPYTLEATDGDLNTSQALWEIAQQGFDNVNYFRAQGLNPDGTRNLDYPVLLDAENLSDYILMTYFADNHDGPASLSMSDSRINNFFGIINRENPDGFKYLLHDVETAFYDVLGDITERSVRAGEYFSGFNPMWLHHQLLLNEEYVQLFADRSYKHLFNNGALTSEECQARYAKRVAEINQAVIGESARWGDFVFGTPYTKLGTWDPVVDRMHNGFMSNRTGVMIGILEERGWLNGLLPPQFEANTFDNESPYVLDDESYFILINPNSGGEIYYTVNNTDPRAIGGDVAPEALVYSAPIDVDQTVFLKARVKEGENWSPLLQQPVMTHSGINLLISEISYHPTPQIILEDTLTSKSLEFIEIKNAAWLDQDLSHFELTGGISYTFPMHTLLPVDSLVVVASDTAVFRKLYGFAALGPYQGSLSDEGEKVELVNPGGEVRASIYYNEDDVWYTPTNGGGYTLVFKDYDRSQWVSNPADWRVSTYRLGSPGKDDPVDTIPVLIINEVLANSAYPLVDAIEIFNPSGSEVDISNYYLSDEKDAPGKWQIPEGTVVAPESYLVFYEGHYVNDTLAYNSNEFGNAFSISSGGERISLYTASAIGEPGSFVTDLEVPPTFTNISYGKYLDPNGNFVDVHLADLTFGTSNTTAYIGPVIFNNIMYHPAGNNYEFISLKNRSDSVVYLFDEDYPSARWKVKGIGFDFPDSVFLHPGDSLFIIEKTVQPDDFRDVMHLDENILVYNYPGKLKNSSEDISLQVPVVLIQDTTVEVKYTSAETVEYDDDLPWPSEADGDGYALFRLNPDEYGNHAENWISVFFSLPEANAGENIRARIGSSVTLNASGSRDPALLPLSYDWEIVSAPEGSLAGISDTTSVSPEITPDIVGDYLLRLRVSNGITRSTTSYVSIFAYTNQAPVASVVQSVIRINTFETAVLDAGNSYDPDYDNLGYSWEVSSAPDGSVFTLSAYNQQVVEFIPETSGTFEFEVSAGDGELYSSPVLVRVYVRESTSIDQPISAGGFSLYPNPARNYINIDLLLDEASDIQLSILSIDGKIVYQKSYRGLDVGMQHLGASFSELNLQNGVYLVNIQSASASVVSKLTLID